MKILLSGGGSLGPVTPLLGLVETWEATGEELDLLWVGTTKGPEAGIVESNGIRFISIASVKFPRYFTFYWFIMPFKLIYALIESWNLLKAERPDVIVTAGGYVSVPLVLLGRLMGIRSWVHQQDVLPGLANKIMAKVATKISVTFDRSKPNFPKSKTEHTGNAVRPSLFAGSRERAVELFGLDPSRKTLLVMGGGTGSLWINETISRIAGDLSKEWQIVHQTGEHKLESVDAEHEHYHVVPLVNEEIADLYAVADVVLCRAGLGTMTELVALGKPAIVVPMPGTHQEMNAFFLYENQAALIMDQTETTPQMLLNTVKNLMADEDTQLRLAANLKLSFPKDGTKRIADGVLELAREAEAQWESKHGKKVATEQLEFDEEAEEVETTVVDWSELEDEEEETEDEPVKAERLALPEASEEPSEEPSEEELIEDMKQRPALSIRDRISMAMDDEDDELPFEVKGLE